MRQLFSDAAKLVNVKRWQIRIPTSNAPRLLMYSIVDGAATAHSEMPRLILVDQLKPNNIKQKIVGLSVDEWYS